MDYIPRRVNKLVGNILKKYQTKKNQLGSRYYKNVYFLWNYCFIQYDLKITQHNTVR